MKMVLYAVILPFCVGGALSAGLSVLRGSTHPFIKIYGSACLIAAFAILMFFYFSQK